MTTRSLKSEFTYVRDLIEAGWEGALSAGTEDERRASARIPARALLAPAAVGAGLGALSASVGKNRTSGYGVVVAGFIGSAIGLGVGAAWVSRDLAARATRRAVRKVNAVRDAHWLEKHPIAYA